MVVVMPRGEARREEKRRGEEKVERRHSRSSLAGRRNAVALVVPFSIAMARPQRPTDCHQS